jgi:hypothetical protein
MRASEVDNGKDDINGNGGVARNSKILFITTCP